MKKDDGTKHDRRHEANNLAHLHRFAGGPKYANQRLGLSRKFGISRDSRLRHTLRAKARTHTRYLHADACPRQLFSGMLHTSVPGT